MKRIKAKTNGGKLIKGHTYVTDFISDYGNCSVSTTDGIHIGWLNSEHFTNPDGSEIPRKKYDTRQKTNEVELKEGDILVCLSNKKSKVLVKDGKYRIKKVIINKHSYWNDAYVILEGYTRKLKFNTWDFRKLNTKEARKLTIGQIFDKKEDFSVENVRKFEASKDKHKELIEAIAKSIRDHKRHQLSVIDWAIQKTSKEMKFKKGDFDEMLNMNLGDILDMIDGSETN